MISGYMLTEARDAKPGEDLWALGRRFRKEGDGQVRFVTHVVQHEPTIMTAREVARQFTLATALRKGWDAAFPPASPPDVEFVAGYIGGGTPHVWTDAEWAASTSKSTAQLRLPIFVRVPPTTRDPVVEANFSADWAEAHDQPKGTLIALDYETSTVQGYLDAFDAQIVKRGYKTIVYGSRSTVMTLSPPSGGRWSATWNNVPHVDSGAVITQYGGDVTLGQPYDLNLALDSVEFWDTTGGTVADFSTEQAAFLRALRDSINAKSDALYRLLARPSDGRANLADLKAAVADVDAEVEALQAEEDKTQAAIDLLQQGGVSAAEVANAVIAGVGPEMARETADLIAQRLAS